LVLLSAFPDCHSVKCDHQIMHFYMWQFWQSPRYWFTYQSHHLQWKSFSPFRE